MNVAAGRLECIALMKMRSRAFRLRAMEKDKFVWCFASLERDQIIPDVISANESEARKWGPEVGINWDWSCSSANKMACSPLFSLEPTSFSQIAEIENQSRPLRLHHKSRERLGRGEKQLFSIHSGLFSLDLSLPLPLASHCLHRLIESGPTHSITCSDPIGN